MTQVASLPLVETSKTLALPETYLIRPWQHMPDLFRGPVTTEESSRTFAIALAPWQEGSWYFEPSYNNSFDFFYHTGTGTVLSASHDKMTLPKNSEICFRGITLKLPEPVWLHCRGIPRPDPKVLESFAVGVVDILDFKENYITRRHFLESRLEELGIKMPAQDKYYFLIPRVTEGIKLNLWCALQEVNLEQGAIIYDGIVAKKAESLYERQLDDFKHTNAFWHYHPFST